MARIERIRVALTGFPGGPGIATFYATNAAAAVPPLRTLWAAFATSMPGDVAVKVISNGDAIEDTTGVLVGSWSVADAVGYVGTGTTGYAAPVGFAVTWLTDTILDGHRVKGRTFVVPVVSEAFQTDGSLQATVISGNTTVTEAYVAATTANSLIWHRPRLARAANGTVPAVTARAGGHAFITASRIADMAAVLRSRRD